jgi:hypothetical protein
MQIGNLNSPNIFSTNTTTVNLVSNSITGSVSSINTLYNNTLYSNIINANTINGSINANTINGVVEVRYGGTGANNSIGGLLKLGGQPLNGVLNSLSSFNSNGYIVQTSSNTFVSRSIQGGSRISITNSDGLNGNTIIYIPDMPIDLISNTVLITSSTKIANNVNNTTIPTSAAVDDHVKSLVIGYNQDSYDVTSSRVVGTTYQNTTGKAIFMAIEATVTSGRFAIETSSNNNVFVIMSQYPGTGTTSNSGNRSTIIAANQYYRVRSAAGSTTINAWTELR